MTHYTLHMYPNTFLTLPVPMPDQDAPGNIQQQMSMICPGLVLVVIQISTICLKVTCRHLDI